MDYTTELKKLFKPIKYKGREIFSNPKGAGYICNGMSALTLGEMYSQIDIVTQFESMCRICGKPIPTTEKYCNDCIGED